MAPRYRRWASTAAHGLAGHLALCKSICSRGGCKAPSILAAKWLFGELYRLGASRPVQYDAGNGRVRTCSLSEKQRRSQELREGVLSELERSELEGYGQRGRFPAKSADLLTRWRSAYLKIMVSDSVIRDLDALEAIGKRGKFPAKGSVDLTPAEPPCGGALMEEVDKSLSGQLEQSPKDVRLLIVSGERRRVQLPLRALSCRDMRRWS